MGPLLTPWNVGIWGALWLGLFTILETLAAFKRYTESAWGWAVPWDTFSRFCWDLQIRFEWVTLGVIFLLGVLASHLIRLASVQEGDRRPIRHQVAERRIARATKVLTREHAVIAQG